jgi:acyl carrier protein
MVSTKDILSIIHNIEINIDRKQLDFSMPLSEQGLDSLDMTSILFAIEEKFEIKISEADIEEGKLTSIDGMVSYINDAK